MTGSFQVYTSGASGIQGFAYNLPAGEWAFICGTMSENPTELYVDGELFGGAAKGPGGGVAEVPANPLTIAESFGAKAAFGNAEIFNGIIICKELIHCKDITCFRVLGVFNGC